MYLFFVCSKNIFNGLGNDKISTFFNSAHFPSLLRFIGNKALGQVLMLNGVNTFEKSSYYVLSSEYNSTHWMSVEDLKYLL